MQIFKGKYDKEVLDIVNNFSNKYEIDRDNKKELNSYAQNHFNTIKGYFMNVVSITTMLKYFNEIKNEYNKNGNLRIIDELIYNYNHISDINIKDVKKHIYKIGEYSLKMLLGYYDSIVSIKEEALSLHHKKNEMYGDGWYNNGVLGSFFDLYRKMSRLNTLVTLDIESNDSTETLKDTLIDTFNYSVLLIVALTFIDF